MCSSDAFRERQVYKAQCQVAEESVVDMVTQDVVPGFTAANTRDITMHYSVDYIQNLLLPIFAQQPGKLYFKTGRKVNKSPLYCFEVHKCRQLVMVHYVWGMRITFYCCPY